MKRPILLGLIALQLLLMGAAFVAGRMMAGQDQRSIRQPGAALPSQLPKEPMAGSGTVQKIENNIITLTQRGGGGPGGSSSSSNIGLDVLVSSDTKYYKNVSSGSSGMPGGGQTTAQIAEAKLTDIKIGNMLLVWGTKSGSRITADVIYIQGQSFGLPGQ